MPRYFFHLFDGRAVVVDPEGIELPDGLSAISEAQEDCRSFAIEELKAGRPFPLWSAVEICDHAGKVLHIEWCKDLIPRTPFDPDDDATAPAMA